MAVDRCICKSVPFTEALRIARASGCGNVAELQRHTPLGTGCGLCVPYMQMVIRTGECDLPVLSVAQIRQLAEASGVAIEQGVR